MLNGVVRGAGYIRRGQATPVAMLPTEAITLLYRVRLHEDPALPPGLSEAGCNLDILSQRDSTNKMKEIVVDITAATVCCVV